MTRKQEITLEFLTTPDFFLLSQNL